MSKTITFKANQPVWVKRPSPTTWQLDAVLPGQFIGLAKQLHGSQRFRVRLMIPGYQRVVTCDASAVTRRTSNERSTNVRQPLVKAMNESELLEEHLRCCLRRCEHCGGSLCPSPSGDWSICAAKPRCGGLLPMLTLDELAAWLTTKLPAASQLHFHDHPDAFTKFNQVSTRRAYLQLITSEHRAKWSEYIIAWSFHRRSKKIRFHLYHCEMGPLSADAEPAFKFGLVHPERSPLTCLS